MLTVYNRIDECGGRHNKVRDIDLLKMIILHRFGWNDFNEYDNHNITPDAVGVAKFYKSNPEAAAATGGSMPYTFVIGRGGTIWQTCELGIITPHARSFNIIGLGIALLGDFRFLPPTEEQKQSTKELCVALIQYHQMEIKGHTEIPGATKDSNKSCPGNCFDLDRFRNVISRGVELRAGETLVNAGIVL